MSKTPSNPDNYRSTALTERKMEKVQNHLGDSDSLTSDQRFRGSEEAPKTHRWMLSSAVGAPRGPARWECSGRR